MIVGRDGGPAPTKIDELSGKNEALAVAMADTRAAADEARA